MFRCSLSVLSPEPAWCLHPVKRARALVLVCGSCTALSHVVPFQVYASRLTCIAVLTQALVYSEYTFFQAGACLYGHGGTCNEREPSAMNACPPQSHTSHPPRTSTSIKFQKVKVCDSTRQQNFCFCVESLLSNLPASRNNYELFAKRQELV